MPNPMDTYERIKQLGPGAKREADNFIGGLSKRYTKENPAPPPMIQEGLEKIVAKYEVGRTNSVTTTQYAGLAAIALLILYLI